MPKKGKDDADTQGYEMITPNKLLSLMKSARSAQKDIQEIAGGLGSEIKTAVENHHLHRKAFSVVKAGDKMEPEKLAEFLAHLDFYLEASGLRKRAASAPRLEVIEGGKNEKPFPQPHGQAAE
jgi:hypothetical protein